jgi:hypothetical protein
MSRAVHEAALCARRDKRSIIRNGYTFRGIGVIDRGVFTDRDGKDCETYAGQIKGGFACGLGVLACPGSKIYAEHGPDGKMDGRYLDSSANGFAGYILFERGARTQQAWVWADGECDYNDEDCAPDDPRLLALIGHVAPVEALARYREPTVVSELVAELLTLPSGLLAIVCDAIVR